MTVAAPAPVAAAPSRPVADGRARLARNVFSSWGGEAIAIAAGFVLPRVVDAHLGMASLGIWDFGWSIVSYMNLFPLGVGGSGVSRFIAADRARGDVAGLRATASTARVIQLGAAAAAALFTAGVAASLPRLFGERLGAGVGEAQALVLLLGAAVAVQFAFDAYRGILAGCQRTDVNSLLGSVAQAVNVALMIGVVLAGGGLRGLGAVVLAGAVGAELTRRSLARRVCPELRLGWAHVRASRAKELFRFGVKGLLNQFSYLTLVQANSMILAACAGPAALALYSRPNALIRTATTLVNRYAHVLIPLAGELEARGDREGLRELLLESGRICTYLALPMALGLTIMADPILQLWMGAHYREGALVAVLVLGALPPLAQRTTTSILFGLDAHGRLAYAWVAAAVLGVALGAALTGWLGMGVIGAALAISIPPIFVSGIYGPLLACRRLGVSPRRYLVETTRGPLACAVPFALALGGARAALDGRPLAALLVGSGAGALVLAPLYWRYALPAAARERVIVAIERRLRGRRA